MTAKPETFSNQVPVPDIDPDRTTASGPFDFGAAAGTRKRLFQFAKPGLAKRRGKTALGPTRSEFGCD